MADPLVPNFNKNTGRLVTDRFDFQDHVTGNSSQHTAQQIVLDPPVSVLGTDKTNLQAALITISGSLNPTLPDATDSVKGVIRLTGDVGGSSTNLIVQRLRGRSVSTLIPSDGDVLTWDGTNTVWVPSAGATAFQASGDLAGSSTVQQVVGATGSGNVFRMSCDNIRFTEDMMSPTIYQEDNTASGAATLSIYAQNSNFTNGDGGDIIISSGSANGSGTGKGGGVTLQIENGNSTLLHVAVPSAGRSVLGLVGQVNSSNMPDNTGNHVIYIANTSLPPTTGNPVGGSILYSSGGKLYVKQSDSNNFAIGSLPTPFIWGTSDAEVYTSRVKATSLDSGPAITALSISIPDNTAVIADAIFVGKPVGQEDLIFYHLGLGFSRDGGSTASTIGSITNIEAIRDSLGIATPPTIIRSTNTIQVKTGTDGIDINWLVVTKLYFSSPA